MNPVVCEFELAATSSCCCCCRHQHSSCGWCCSHALGGGIDPVGCEREPLPRRSGDHLQTNEPVVDTAAGGSGADDDRAPVLETSNDIHCCDHVDGVVAAAEEQARHAAATESETQPWGRYRRCCS